jgi:hypothetical protein
MLPEIVSLDLFANPPRVIAGRGHGLRRRLAFFRRT